MNTSWNISCLRGRVLTVRAATGFTLVELLVVIAIIGTLVGLLLPAVQAARETARRSSCQNNLKQIGIAVHNYHDAKNQFPGCSVGNIKWTCGSGTGSEPSTALGPLVLLLPWMEQNSLYQKFDLSKNFRSSTNWSAAYGRTPPVGLLCPSYNGDQAGIASHYCSPSDANNTNFWVGASCYLGVKGTDQYGLAAETQGIFGIERVAGTTGAPPYGGTYQAKTTRLRNVTDGTSKTFLFGEFRPDWSKMLSSANGFNSVDSRWAPWSVGVVLEWSGSVKNMTYGPNQVVPGAYATWGVFPFSSQHTGGVTMAMADGSVKFVQDQVDIAAWQAAATIAGGVDYALD
jgi:prepilin-type N-terminal cleavage/methylation domain-containing protein/prepilin-type processing-associated H-X9-DG protein